MIEKIAAWSILSLLLPVVLMAVTDYSTGKGFWSDYKDAVIAIAGIALVIAGILSVTWSLTVVFK